MIEPVRTEEHRRRCQYGHVRRRVRLDLGDRTPIPSTIPIFRPMGLVILIARQDPEDVDDGRLGEGEGEADAELGGHDTSEGCEPRYLGGDVLARSEQGGGLRWHRSIPIRRPCHRRSS